MEGAGDDIPDGWTAKVSRSSGQAYYVNRFTNESQWEKPEGFQSTDTINENYDKKIYIRTYIRIKETKL